jgi:F0F1-type ATP synthase assembly protein I
MTTSTVATVLSAQGAGSTAGPLGLLVVLLIGLSLVLLIRNMNGRLRRLPPSFDQQGKDAQEPGAPEDRPAP